MLPRKWRTLVSVGIWAVAIGLCWQVVQSNLVERAPATAAVQIAPNSAAALARAAEAALAQDRLDDAQRLAGASLRLSPFNVRALRTFGLVQAREGRVDQADQLITLAGNWSLRDDPSHAWLIQQRLKQGNYASAFAHADTLLRRRSNARDQLFALYTQAAKHDQRALPPLIGLLAQAPPWRTSYLQALVQTPDTDQVLLGVALALGKSAHPLSDGDLQTIYEGWIGEGRYSAISYLRTRLSPGVLLADGDFQSTQSDQRPPFAWELTTSAGLSAEIRPDDSLPSNRALRVFYNGYSDGVAARQMLVLPPGERHLSARYMRERPSGEPSFGLALYCAETRQRIAHVTDAQAPSDSAWHTVSGSFTVPSAGCAVQWLAVEPAPGNGPSQRVFWIDDIEFRG